MGPQNSGTVEFTITIDAPEESKDVRLWVPYPVSDRDQSIGDIKIAGNYDNQGIYKEPGDGNMALYAEWKSPAEERRLTISFKATAMERVRKDFTPNQAGIPAEVERYTKAEPLIPTDGEVAKAALEATKGKKTIAEKARAVYDWVVENTVRDPEAQGCGLGNVEVTIAKKSGKCVDLSSVFVALARAAGVPAREVFGLRLGKEPGASDLTKGHHCWGEFYLPGYGWTPVDPADVRKKMLEEKLDLDHAKDIREYYFGAVDQNRIVLGKGERGHDLNPRQNGGPLNYFMYPYAEVDGKGLEWLAAQKELKYKVSFLSLK
ncbi:MAG: transglutaminase domain-containing protein [Nitrospinae bacterium]|nr:transglutaminase domain-containing protein [Nitrospinota bacterium]